MQSELNAEHLVKLADKFGTPLYVYNGDRIAIQYKKLTDAFLHWDTRIFYACKALTNINILAYLKKLGAGLDCVSINEVRLGLMAGFKPADILFTPNCVDMEEMLEARELGVNLNIDSISMLEQFGHRFGAEYPVFLRINPHIMAGGHYKISTGHVDSKFGISIHQMRHIERIVRNTGLKVTGIHMHTGSEIKDIGVFLEGLDVMLNIASHFPDLTCIDLGSGFKVPYQPGEKATDVNLLGEKITERMTQYEKETGKKLQVWFEPGKYLVSEAGYFIVKANIIKQTPSTVFVGVNSGFNHLIRPMMYDAYHHIENISNPKGPVRIYSIVGNICETDTFAWDRSLPEVRESDYLVFHNAGAYGFEMSSHFNSRLRPAEVMIEGGQAVLIRRRDEFQDLLRNQVISIPEKEAGAFTV